MFFSAKSAFLDSLKEDEENQDASNWFTSSEETSNAFTRSTQNSDRKSSSAASSSARKSPEFDEEEDLFSRHINERRKEAVSTFLANYNNDLYYILGVSFSATKVEIKKAFKQLSLENHPDKLHFSSNNSNQRDYVQILQAYNILASDTLRPIYDEQGYQAALQAMASN